MYTEAFLFVGNLLQNGLIKKVEFGKNKFKVTWSDGGKTKYNYNENGVIEFLELYEDQEEQTKK
jgi:hypothetical protein